MLHPLTRLIRSGRWFNAAWLPATTAIILLTAFAPATATGQPVQNPKVLEFDPSADHVAVLQDGTPVVSRYDFELYLAGAVAPFHTVNIGKPALGTDGKVRVDFSSQMASWPLPGGTYESRVAAVGPGGTGRSAVSNQFQFAAESPNCTYTVSPTAVAATGLAGTANVTVTPGSPSCPWTTTTAITWLTATPASATGPATVAIAWADNGSRSQRVGTVTVGDKTVTVTQAPRPVQAPNGLKVVKVKK